MAANDSPRRPARDGDVRRHRPGSDHPWLQSEHGHLLQRRRDAHLPGRHRPQDTQLPRLVFLIHRGCARHPGRIRPAPGTRVRRHPDRRRHLLPDRRRRPFRRYQRNPLPDAPGRHGHCRGRDRDRSRECRRRELPEGAGDRDDHCPCGRSRVRLSPRLSADASGAHRRRRRLCRLRPRPGSRRRMCFGHLGLPRQHRWNRQRRLDRLPEVQPARLQRSGPRLQPVLVHPDRPGGRKHRSRLRHRRHHEARPLQLPRAHVHGRWPGHHGQRIVRWHR